MIRLIIIAVLIACLQGCTPHFYVPNTANIPMLTEKGDLEVNAGFGSCGNDFQAAFAITDNAGVMVNGSFSDYQSEHNSRYHKHQFVEVAGGYTKVLKEVSESDFTKKYIFSGYAGVGVGNAEGYVSSSNIFDPGIVTTNTISGRYAKFFVQPAIGRVKKSRFLILSLRTSMVDVQDLKGTTNGNSITKSTHIGNIFLEPVLTWKFGWDNVKFYTQTGFSSFNKDGDVPFEHRPIIFNMGMNFRVSEFFN